MYGLATASELDDQVVDLEDGRRPSVTGAVGQ